MCRIFRWCKWKPGPTEQNSVWYQDRSLTILVVHSEHPCVERLRVCLTCLGSTVQRMVTPDTWNVNMLNKLLSSPAGTNAYNSIYCNLSSDCCPVLPNSVSREFLWVCTCVMVCMSIRDFLSTLFPCRAERLNMETSVLRGVQLLWRRGRVHASPLPEPPVWLKTGQKLSLHFIHSNWLML